MVEFSRLMICYCDISGGGLASIVWNLPLLFLFADCLPTTVTFGRVPSPTDCPYGFLNRGPSFVLPGLAESSPGVDYPMDVVIAGGLPGPPDFAYEDLASVGASYLESIVRFSPCLPLASACCACFPGIGLEAGRVFEPWVSPPRVLVCG